MALSYQLCPWGNRVRYVIAAAALLLLAACAVTVPSAEQRPRTFADAATYPVELIFVLDSGERVSNIPVVVLDAQGREIFKGLVHGHILDLALPDGYYRVTATFGKRALMKSITVSARPVRELFVW